jgi:cobyrinic acid a,c-diamide synthase
VKLELPRLMVAAPASGSGKTTVTCALLQALTEAGECPAAFKCGPDYIDPMFHEAVTGAPARNLDLFLLPENTVKALLARGAAGRGVAVLEGVMGYYDGLGGDTPIAGSWHLASVTGTPVVLVLRCKGMSPLTAAALVKGIAAFREGSGVAALLLNQVSHGAYPLMKRVLERETGLPVAGYLPQLPDCSLESRHLGLAGEELPGLRQKAERLAAALRETADLELLMELARSAQPLEYDPLPPPERLPEQVPVAVARDAAFSFYYRDALELLEEMGAELLEFSPLEDAALPAGSRGLLLGGGYPELFARRLSENHPMRESVKQAVSEGMPTIAECGGFLYLHETLKDPEGNPWPMAGVIPAGAENAGKLRQFGYGTLTARREGLLLPAGESLPAHSFHYWESGAQGDAFTFQKSTGRSWADGWSTPSLYAGFPHFHLAGSPRTARRFLEACAVFMPKQAERR